MLLTGALFAGTAISAVFSNEASLRVHAAGEEFPVSYHISDEELAAYPATRNQDPQGRGWNTCWSFAAIALAEFDAVTNLGAGSDIDLSEMGLAYYSCNSGKDPMGTTAGDTTVIGSDPTRFITYGGNLDFAIETIACWNGLMGESAIPYNEASLSSLADGTGNFQPVFGNALYHLEDAYSFKMSRSSSDVKKMIMEHGAIATSVYAGSSADDYGNVYYDSENNSFYYKKGVMDYPSGLAPYANHTVVIVGWDDEFPKEAFVNEAPDNGAWLVRNSWSDGSARSMDSYFWLSYYDEGISSKAYALKMGRGDNYDNNYQYDGGILTNTSMPSINTTVSANIFRTSVSQTEELRAVAIHPNKPCNYTIRIYRNLTDNSYPTDGEEVLEQSGRCEHSGFFTIPLDTPVSLKAGEYFAVEAELDGARMTCEYGSSNIYVDDGEGYIFESRCGIKAGQSFFEKDGEYVDLATYRNAANRVISAAADGMGYGNIRIKAYTNNTGETIKPIAVKNLTAKKTDTEVTLNWDSIAASATEGYLVYRLNKSGVYTKIKKITDPSETSCVIKSLAKNTTYKFAVCSYRTIDGNLVKGKLTKLSVKTKK